ncbi:phosphotransferase family protein [Baekduia sp. Peel2402]|uniref:phosphotransferase family protein n=1 Tax=Baekduia sp. Peel2402 TaxID=3458296 RepID=UPI00403ECDC7
MSSATVVGLDAAAVAAWLADAAGLREPVAFARIGQGQSNLTFLATDAEGRRVVLRRPPLGELLASAHDVAREHRILSALTGTGVPIPPVVAFTEDPAVTDVPLLAMGFVDGWVVEDPTAVDEQVALALPRALATIHAVDLEEIGLLDLASHKPYAARQLKRWRRQWEDSATRSLPVVGELADRLEAAMPAQRELTLVHGDFHVLNVILAPDGSAVRAILDWELCTLGDPLADLGGLMAYASPSLTGIAAPQVLAEAYMKASGREVTAAALAFWHALGLWKIAVIVEGVRRRALDDPRNAPDGGVPPEHLVDDLIAQARLVAFEAGF